MADYGYGSRGDSLRDALNAIQPLLGMGEYNAMFPPNTGAPAQGEPPVPIPRPRPPQLNPQIMQQPVPIAPGAAPNLAMPQGVQGPPGVQGQIQSLPYGGQAGGVALPMGPNVALTAGGMRAPGGNWAARLGLAGGF